MAISFLGPIAVQHGAMLTKKSGSIDISIELPSFTGAPLVVFVARHYPIRDQRFLCLCRFTPKFSADGRLDVEHGPVTPQEEDSKMTEKRGTSSVAALVMARAKTAGGEISEGRPGADGGSDGVREPGAGGDKITLTGAARGREADGVKGQGQSPFPRNPKLYQFPVLTNAMRPFTYSRSCRSVSAQYCRICSGFRISCPA
jgi:hypothetical protein